MTDEDPLPSDPGEQLLAEAMRAKASQGAGAQTTPLYTEPTERLPVVRQAAGAPKRLEPGWILLLAVLLGLATGTVIGLLTVL